MHPRKRGARSSLLISSSIYQRRWTDGPSISEGSLSPLPAVNPQISSFIVRERADVERRMRRLAGRLPLLLTRQKLSIVRSERRRTRVWILDKFRSPSGLNTAGLFN
ncbi:hypothetical protein GWI33_000519 [Rhynchophorus ferrugineus]|uniref:Uncharacterized protein n=1 Tax=Rhynchophorus ferrugineus TaxID=354439 RepID=A0A834LXT8_RHYFE|nr:hypothetical protein GWI33_000519 [Rhynchophorus ferrugineus]